MTFKKNIFIIFLSCNARFKKTPKFPFKYNYKHMGAVVSPLKRKYTQLIGKEEAQGSHVYDLNTGKWSENTCLLLLCIKRFQQAFHLPQRRVLYRYFRIILSGD